jgi:hypothetical protein
VIRPDSILHELPVDRWNTEEGLSHLMGTFDRAVAERPDLMEPYLIRLEGTDDSEAKAIVRQALRETFTRRHPNRFARPADASMSESG